ncbi:MAG: methyltransferase domain-containing protein [Chloroflexi bacterium]|nr:methyltransferase domain-containing protein [Chloroflexota bacterium]
MSLGTLISILTTLVRLLQQLSGLRSKAKPAAGEGAGDRKTGEKKTREEKSRPKGAPTSPAPSSPVASPSRRPRRVLAGTLGMLFAAGFAGTTAYLVTRQRQRRAVRRRPVHAPFPEELLDVLAPPGGDGHFFYAGEGLINIATDAFYPVVDGIPDFGAPHASGAQHALEIRRHESAAWVDFYDPLVRGILVPFVWQGNTTGEAALAGAVAGEAFDGWCLAVPCGTGALEIEMARANPHAKFLCLDGSWEMLLEARRRALEAGLANLYFARGDAELLPLQSGVFDSLWSANGFHVYPHPEQAITELTRVAKPGAIIAGVSLVPGGPPLADTVMRAMSRQLPGLRDVSTHLSLLTAAGLREMHAFRDGATVRFLGTRAG